MKNIGLIAKNEFRSLVKGARFKVLSVLVLILILLSAIGGYTSYQSIKKERQLAQQEVRSSWLNQEEKNPHSAAHYGTFVFRPKSILSFFDFGVDTYVGNSIFLEAHRQNDSKFSAASESSSNIRFGEMSLAFILQVLIPLMIIFLGFNLVTQEKEGKTLRLVLSQGIALREVAWGKILGLFTAIIILVLPALLVLIFVGQLNIDLDGQKDFYQRLTLISLFYFLYLFLISAISIYVSSISKSSRDALLSLLGLWIMICLLIPKVSANLGVSLNEAPSAFEFRQAIAKDEENGIDGHNPYDKRFERLKDSILLAYKVKAVEELPINFNAVAMQEGEKYSSMIYNKHFNNLKLAYQKQNLVSAYASLINPYLAVRNISMALSGTDMLNTIEFDRQAEVYRFRMVEFLNNYLRDFSLTGQWDKKAGKDIYKSIPDFQFEAITVSTVLKNSLIAVLSFIIWMGIIFILVNRLNDQKNI